MLAQDAGLRERIRSFSCFVVTLIFIVSACVAAEEEVPWAKGDVVATGVSRVYLAPDGRQWHGRRLQRETIDEFKQLVETAWTGQSPAEIGPGSILTFGPGDTVWFSYPQRVPNQREQRYQFLGYDGQRWQEHDVGLNRPLGMPAGHVGDYTAASNVVAADHAFVVGQRSIWTLDDDGIETLQLLPENLPDRPQPPPIRLAAEPDGLGVVAYCEGADHQAWRWRDGSWFAIEPAPLGQIEQIVPDADGFWARASDGRVVFTAFTPVDANDPLRTLVERLADVDQAVRDEATEQLIRRGQTILPQLEALKEDVSVSDGAKLRLQYAIARIKRPRPRAAPKPVRIGDYVLQAASDVFRFGDGSLVIAARQVASDADDGFAMGLLHRRGPTGQWTLHLGEEALRTWTHPTLRYGGWSLRALAAGPHRAWLPGDHETTPPVLVDSDLTPLFRMPIPPSRGRYRMRVVGLDGTLHVNLLRTYDSSTIAFRPEPGLPPLRPIRTFNLGQSQQAGFDLLRKAGPLYTLDDLDIVRVNGPDDIEIVHRLEQPARSLAAGHNGLLLVTGSEPTHQLIGPEGAIDTSDERGRVPDDLIQRNLDRFLEAFKFSRKMELDGTQRAFVDPYVGQASRASDGGIFIWRDGDRRLELHPSQHNDDVASTLTLRFQGKFLKAKAPGLIESRISVGKSPSVVLPLDDETRFFVSTPGMTYRLDFATGELSDLRFHDLGGEYLRLQYPLGDTAFFTVGNGRSSEPKLRLFTVE